MSCSTQAPRRTIRALFTWSDALKPPFPPADAERLLRDAFLAACHAHVLRAVSDQAIAIEEASEALRLLAAAVHSLAANPSRTDAIAQLQRCANALLSVAYRLNEETREVHHAATMLDARDDGGGGGRVDIGASITAPI